MKSNYKPKNKQYCKYSSINTFKISLFILIASAAITLVTIDRKWIFTINAITETVEFTVTNNDKDLFEWNIGSSNLIYHPEADNDHGTELGNDAKLKLTENTKVTINRQGIEKIHINIKSKTNDSAGSIDNQGKVTRLGKQAIFTIHINEKPLLLPFIGRLTTGDDVADGVDSILLSGTVSVMEEQLIGRARYVVNIEKLDAGDRVQLWSRDHTETTSYGFIRADSTKGVSNPINALTVIAHSQADHAQVERFGSAGYKIYAPQWARFLHDPWLVAATSIITIIVLLLEFSSKCAALVVGKK